jgi:transposase-like protein
MGTQTPLMGPKTPPHSQFQLFAAAIRKPQTQTRSRFPKVDYAGILGLSRFAPEPKMPAPIDPNLKSQIRRAYANSKATPAELSEQFGVSERSIQNWVKSEGWDAERKAQNVIDFARPLREPREERPPIRSVPTSQDPIEIADTIIKDLQGEMVANMPGRDKASVANAIRAWVEYREKLQPTTVEALAELVVQRLAAGRLSVRDLVQALKARSEDSKRA